MGHYKLLITRARTLHMVGVTDISPVSRILSRAIHVDNWYFLQAGGPQYRHQKTITLTRGPIFWPTLKNLNRTHEPF